MAVLHITYKHDPQTSTADYDGVCTVLKSYHYVRFSASNWPIDTEEPVYESALPVAVANA